MQPAGAAVQYGQCFAVCCVRRDRCRDVRCAAKRNGAAVGINCGGKRGSGGIIMLDHPKVVVFSSYALQCACVRRMVSAAWCGGRKISVRKFLHFQSLGCIIISNVNKGLKNSA